MFAGVQADVYFTGEMSHHEVKDAVAGGVNVILCTCPRSPQERRDDNNDIHFPGGHTNTERGYLPILGQKLKQALTEFASAEADAAHASALRSLEVEVSKEDKHPLQIV